jgi:asparagine synthetase B (glutamine-hydrolysing)
MFSAIGFKLLFYLVRRVFYIDFRINISTGLIMSDEVRYYKGKHKVRVLTESRGNWIVETLEAFEDIVNGEKIKVKKGERRIVAPNLLFQREALPPPVKEHVYELKMEKKLKRLVKEEEDEDKTA